MRDKGHVWSDSQQLIPDALALGLMGYAYLHSDMICGGEYSYSYDNPDKPLDQELIVRSAQCSALMPMMQFSVAPWRVLSKDNMAICRDMAWLHERMGQEILALVETVRFDVADGWRGVINGVTIPLSPEWREPQIEREVNIAFEGRSACALVFRRMPAASST